MAVDVNMFLRYWYLWRLQIAIGSLLAIAGISVSWELFGAWGNIDEPCVICVVFESRWQEIKLDLLQVR